MKKGVDYIGVGVGAVIFDRDGKVFLAKRGKQARNEKGRWECPGGAVEFGETLKQTLVREVKEEIGIEIEILELLGVSDEIIPEEKQHWISPSFICIVKSGTPTICEPEKCDQIGWFSLEEIRGLPLSVATKSNFMYLRKRYPKTVPNFYA